MNREAAPPIDVGKAIDDGAWTTFQKSVLALASLAFIVDALANQVMAISIPAIMRDWHVTRADFSSVVAMGWVGVAIGTVLAGSLADRVGRKPMLLISVLIFGVATTAVAFVNDINTLLIVRTIDGIGIGGALPTATTLIAEFTPARRRSRAVNIGLICIPLGNFICGAIGSAILPVFGWRTLFLTSGSIALLVGLILLAALPESPRYLINRPDRRAQLMRGLKQLNIPADKDSIWIDGSAKGASGPLAALFGRDTLVTTLAIWGGFFFCFLGIYSSLNWMPTLLSGQGYSLSVSSAALSAAGVGGMIGSLAMAKLIETIGSRRALIVAALGAALGAIALVQIPLDPKQSPLPLLIALAWLSLCLNGITGCIYALAAFVYPPFVKGTGLGAAAAIGRLGAIVSSFVAVAVLAIGSNAFFLFIGTAAVVSMACLMVLKRHIPSDAGFVRGAAAIR